MITRVAAGTTRDFTNDEIDAMKKESHAGGTSEVLNRARRNAGQKGDDVLVRGADGTLDKTLEHQKTHIGVGETMMSGAHALEIAGAAGAHVPLVGGLLHGPFGIVGMGVVTFVGIQVALAELQHAKDEKRDAATRDVMRAGMLMSLELPKEFVNDEVARLDVRTMNTDPSVKIRNQIVDTPLGAALQLHCDQGITSGDDFLASRRATKEEFFAMLPKVGQRYAEDAAFRAGFDAIVWASQRAPADAAQLLADVQRRDARYASAQIQYRM